MHTSWRQFLLRLPQPSVGVRSSPHSPTTEFAEMKPGRVQTFKKFADRGMKSSLTGIFANMPLAVTKCTAGLWGLSFALGADGLESAADVLSGLVVYFGLK